MSRRRTHSKLFLNPKSSTRSLSDLSGIGKAMLKDFELLGIHSVEQLAQLEGQAIYDRLCKVTKSKQDPCVLDTFNCAVAQARDPELPSEQKNWWWWSRQRKVNKGSRETKRFTLQAKGGE